MKDFELTPARFDVLYALTRSNVEKTQMGLRKALGVARATISEMLSSLEDLGWIERRPCMHDGRTRRVELTAIGRQLLESAYARVVGEGIVPITVDAALTRHDPEVDSFEMRDRFDADCWRIRRTFGDGAMRELYPWHPDEYLSALVEVRPGSPDLLELVPEGLLDTRIIDPHIEAREHRIESELKSVDEE